MKMRRSVRNAWIEALRSGEYHQTQGALAVLDRAGKPLGHCCLGVLSELAIKDGVGVVIGRDEDSTEFCSYDGKTDFPPTAVELWATEHEHSAWMVAVPSEEDPDEVDYLSLADQNDAGATFGEIATLLERDINAEDDIRDDEPAAEVTA